MWYTWTAVLLVSCTLAGSSEVPTTEPPAPVGTTRAPPRTLDREPSELAWHKWLMSPELRNQISPPRRITTKSLFITPLNCPKGQRLDRNGCIEVVTINKGEHERILLEQLNALFTASPVDNIDYDYGDGPLQLTIPINLDPEAAPLQAPEPSAENILQVLQQTLNMNKKTGNQPNNGASLEAELELLKLQNSHLLNNTLLANSANGLNYNFLPLQDKPKRDSPLINETESEIGNKTTEEGQKELVYGNVNVDPVIYNTDYLSQQSNKVPSTTAPDHKKESAPSASQRNATNIVQNTITNKNQSNISNNTLTDSNTLKKADDQSKLNPENDYSDIGEAIKLISRYAEVTTDDTYKNNNRKYNPSEENILGTRTKIQHRRKASQTPTIDHDSAAPVETANVDNNNLSTRNKVYYRYPWTSEHVPVPPPNYPFRHLQDYWPERKTIGGVYNTVHGNPIRHHHAYPQNYFRPRGNPNSYVGYAGAYPRQQEAYPGELQRYVRRARQQRDDTSPPLNSNQDVYGLLGLRHWFTGEGTSNR